MKHVVRFLLSISAILLICLQAMSTPVHASEQSIPVIQQIQEDLTALSIGYSNGDSITSVTSDIILPTTGSIHKSSIFWTTNDSSLITSSGHVTRPQGDDRTVILTATATLNDNIASATYKLTVKGLSEKLPYVTDIPTTFTIQQGQILQLKGSIYAYSNLTSVTVKIISNTIDLSYTDTSITNYPNSTSYPLTNFCYDTYSLRLPAGSYEIQIWAKTEDHNDTVLVEHATLVINAWSRDQLNDDLRVLRIGYQGKDTSESVTSDLTLPTIGTIHKSKIEWVSSNPAIISNSGKVTRPFDYDALVTLTATVTLEQDTTTFSVVHIVKALNGDIPKVVDAKSSYLIMAGDRFTLYGMVSSLSLLTDVTVKITPSNSTPIEATIHPNTGTYNLSRISFDTKKLGLQKGNYQIEIWAKTAVTASLTEPILVVPLIINDTDHNLVGLDMEALQLTYSGSDNASSVTNDLTLPMEGFYGSKIRWISSDQSILSNLGKITRPKKDTEVTLTAIIELNKESCSKDFTVLVKKAVQPTGTIQMEVSNNEDRILKLNFSDDLSSDSSKQIAVSTISFHSDEEETIELQEAFDYKLLDYIAYPQAGTYNIEVIYYSDADCTNVIASGKWQLTYPIGITDLSVSDMARASVPEITGIVTSQSELKQISVAVFNAKGKQELKTVRVKLSGTNSYHLVDSKLMDSFNFEKLKKGEKTLVITVEDVDGNQLTLSTDFTVTKK